MPKCLFDLEHKTMKNLKNFSLMIVVLQLAILACGSSPQSNTRVFEEVPPQEALKQEEQGANEEIDYGERVYYMLFNCLKTHVTATGNPDEFIAPNEITIKVTGPVMNAKKLDEADIANNVVWKGWVGIDVIYRSNGEWKQIDHPVLLWTSYKYYEDGRVSGLKIDHYWQEPVINCEPTINTYWFLYE